ncbi:unnamed protein product [Notodromas monacha]|uniref:Poly(A) RNA polymerase mitochondrial-like central palm domain-containing protein n=1 Tax=Notodromas monacha TaxID=399045 RepID=A0A7R9BLZ3_9CRUS|nr:unnamed protein product [Notodromas monacha]CAG0917106.1 unnamed protein product [Notodromas monacha]
MYVDLDSTPMALINTTVDPGINLKNCPSGKACGNFCRISKEVHSPKNPFEEITRLDIVEGGKKLGSVDGGGVPVGVASLPPDKKEGGHSQKGVWERVDLNRHRHQWFGLLFHLPPLACSYLLPTPVNVVPLNTFPPASVQMQMKQPAGSHTPHNNALPPPQYQQIPPHPSFLRPFVFQRSLHFTPSPRSSGTCEPMAVIQHNMRDLRMFSVPTVPPPLRGAARINDVGASVLAQFREHRQRLPASRGFVGGDVHLPFKLPANLLQQYGDTLVSPFDHVESVPSRGSEAERFSALLSEIWSLYAHFRGRFPHGCHLVLVVSSVNGFGLDTSDADMCLIVSNSLIDQRDWAPLILTEVMLVLHTVRGLMYVPAKIPSVKFTNVRTGINCNNTVGLLNT